MNKLKTKMDRQNNSINIEKSNLMHYYYAVNSVDGRIYVSQTSKINIITIVWKWLEEVIVFMYIITTQKFRYGKQI